MKNKLIEFLAKQIINLMPKWKTRILLYSGYLISVYNIFLTPEIISQIHQAFGFNLANNPTFGTIMFIFTFLINVTSQAKELRHEVEIKNMNE